DEEDVVAARLTDGVEGGGGARHGLAHHDGLHVGVGGERRQLGDGGLLLGHELVRVGVGDDVVRILLLESLGGAELFLALGGGAGHDGDLPVGGFLGGSDAREGDQNDRQRQEHAKQFL